jgi:purine-cytosine permease-like protein
MIFAIGQLFAINSLDLYSSGVSLQAMGLKLKRYQAVLLDSVIACGLTMWATFGSTFAIYMKDFVGVIIVWISPWVGIFLVDWMLRKFRYNAKELQRTDSGGLYWGSSGFNWSAIAAFFMGMVLSIMSFSKAPPPVNFPPHWATPISNHYGAVYCDGAAASNCGLQGWTGGADFSVFFGVIGAGLLYFIFVSAGGYVKRQMAKQRELEPSVYS